MGFFGEYFSDILEDKRAYFHGNLMLRMGFPVDCEKILTIQRFLHKPQIMKHQQGVRTLFICFYD